MTATTDSKRTRPLSPHLQIYRPQITSVLSILHRITGVTLCGGMVVLVVWLVALAAGPDTYNAFLDCSKSLIGQLVLLALSFSFFFHLCAGIRHLLWDAGQGFEMKDVYKSGRMVIAASLILTAIVWLQVYGAGL